MLTTILAEASRYTTLLALSMVCVGLIFLVALLAIILVLMQKSNSDGIQGITASSETFFGKHKGKSMDAKLKKWTWICLGIIAVLSIVLYVLQILNVNG